MQFATNLHSPEPLSPPTFPSCCHPLFELPPSSSSTSISTDRTSTPILYISSLSPPTPPVLPPQPTPNPYIPFLPPPAFAVPALLRLAQYINSPDLPRMLHITFLPPLPPPALPPQLTSTPYIPFLLPTPFPAPTLQQLAKHLHRPNLFPYIPILRPLPLPALPPQSTPNPYIPFLLPLLLPAPAFQQIAKHLHSPDLLPPLPRPS